MWTLQVPFHSKSFRPFGVRAGQRQSCAARASTRADSTDSIIYLLLLPPHPSAQPTGRGGTLLHVPPCRRGRRHREGLGKHANSTASVFGGYLQTSYSEATDHA
jgi:hypothetical protein